MRTKEVIKHRIRTEEVINSSAQDKTRQVPSTHPHRPPANPPKDKKKKKLGNHTILMNIDISHLQNPIRHRNSQFHSFPSLPPPAQRSAHT
ncbi:hypothetical protein BofuT4_uP108170.1 [Botrytis cinerea T4]|uniref:Uncharacterized protein n=1 Tax=Botryotinia fuckeliana (strain T4) TaxID=999810 RepID=G2Y731_BOTF4|nr:hypothetical protein BofuT4_uP108170.1 [Botrytis cinerea T4]